MVVAWETVGRVDVAVGDMDDRFDVSVRIKEVRAEIGGVRPGADDEWGREADVVEVLDVRVAPPTRQIVAAVRRPGRVAPTLAQQDRDRRGRDLAQLDAL